MHRRTHGRTDTQVILYSVQCYALTMKIKDFKRLRRAISKQAAETAAAVSCCVVVNKLQCCCGEYFALDSITMT